MMKSYTMDLGGRPLTLEFGEVCKQANGGLLVRYVDTLWWLPLLVTRPLVKAWISSR